MIVCHYRILTTHSLCKSVITESMTCFFVSFCKPQAFFFSYRFPFYLFFYFFLSVCLMCDCSLSEPMPEMIMSTNGDNTPTPCTGTIWYLSISSRHVFSQMGIIKCVKSTLSQACQDRISTIMSVLHIAQ